MSEGRKALLGYIVLYTLLLDHRGKENAVHSCKLERNLNISGRTLRKIIRYLRIDVRQPICSCSKGYYYPNTVEEIIETFSRIYASAGSCMTVCNSLIFRNPGGNCDDGLPFC